MAGQSTAQFLPFETLAKAAIDNLRSTLTLGFSIVRQATESDLTVALRSLDATHAECAHCDPADPLADQLTAASLYATAWRSRTPQFIENYDATAKPDPLLTAWGVQSMAILPVVSAGFRGAVLFFWKRPVTFTEEQKHLLTSMAGYLPTLLSQAQLLNQRQAGEEPLSWILHYIPQGVVFVDFDVAEGWVNPAAAALLRLPAGAIQPAQMASAMERMKSLAKVMATHEEPENGLANWKWVFEGQPPSIIKVRTRRVQQPGRTVQLWLFEDSSVEHEQQQALVRQADELERKVADRTRALSSAVTGLSLEMGQRQRLERELLASNAMLERQNQALRASEHALKESEERLRLALDASSIGIFDCDPDSGLGNWDERCRAAYGIQRDAQVTTQNFFAAVHPDDREKAEAAMQSIRDAGGGRGEASFRTVGLSDGVVRHVEVCANIPPAGHGETQHTSRMIGTVRDVTARKKAEESLMRANADLAQFAYAAAHDLQEPLRNVALSLDLLSQSSQLSFNAEQAYLVNQALEGARRMHRMVTDLLLFSRITSEELMEEPADANSALEQATHNLKSAVTESNARIVADGLPQVPVSSVHLVQLFQSLIGNAITYRKPNSQPEITVRVEQRATDWLFTVADNGIGFDQAYSKRIFGLFKRLHTLEKYRGSGIGLAVCARIVAHYGGRIWAEGESGVGAKFFFTLPMKMVPKG